MPVKLTQLNQQWMRQTVLRLAQSAQGIQILNWRCQTKERHIKTQQQGRPRPRLSLAAFPQLLLGQDVAKLVVAEQGLLRAEHPFKVCQQFGLAECQLFCEQTSRPGA